MTAVEFHRLSNGAGPAHAHGWLVSLACHVLGIGCAIVMMAEIEKPVLPNTFQWEVAMADVLPAVAPPPPTPVEARPMKPVAESQPIMKPVEPVQQRVQEIARAVEAVEPVQQAAREVVTQVEAAFERTEVQQIESQAVTTRQDAVVGPSVSQVAMTSRVAHARSIEAPALIEAVSQARVVEPVEREAPPVEQESRVVEHRVVQQRVVRHRETQVDYGWLRDSLWRRIEELKRYPAQAKMNHWEGKVVVEAVIRDDGSVIALSIAESSGRSILDQEAMMVMKKASPLALKHPLGKSQITILVPISYRLDG